MKKLLYIALATILSVIPTDTFGNNCERVPVTGIHIVGVEFDAAGTCGHLCPPGKTFSSWSSATNVCICC